MNKGSIRARLLVGLAVVAIIAAACSSTGASPRPAPRRAAQPSATYTIGFSNTRRVGNGWREEMICSAKAQAVASARSPTLKIIHRNTDAAGQLADIRDLIAQGRQRDRRQPGRPGRLNPALDEAIDGRHRRRRRRRARSPSPAPTTSRTTRSSTPISAPSGCSSSSAARAPSSTCAASPAIRPTPTATRASRRRSPSTRASRSPRRPSTSWDQDRQRSRSSTSCRSGTQVRRHLDLRHRQRHRRRAQDGQPPLVPIVGADNAGFVAAAPHRCPGLKGAAVTNPRPSAAPASPSALQILDGKKPADRPCTSRRSCGTTPPTRARPR